jgi:flagellar biosynthesis chaperone FliJ
MNPNWHINPNYYQRNSQEFVNSQQIVQRLGNLEHQVSTLIKLIEEHNNLLRSIEQQQNRVITSGSGGAVIVRM